MNSSAKKREDMVNIYQICLFSIFYGTESFEECPSHSFPLVMHQNENFGHTGLENNTKKQNNYFKLDFSTRFLHKHIDSLQKAFI